MRSLAASNAAPVAQNNIDGLLNRDDPQPANQNSSEIDNLPDAVWALNNRSENQERPPDDNLRAWTR